MCGHVGIAGNLTTPLVEAFEQLLYLDALRGKDGTGICGYKNGSKWPDIIKQPLPASDFLNTKDAKRLLNKATSFDVLLGHNRAATRGELKEENTHPFKYEHIVLAHNGTLWSQGGLKEWEHTVDSANIARNMAKYGEKETLGGLCGPFALVWLNIANKTLNIMRNAQRPLCCAYTANKEAFFWASEKRYLKFIEEGTIKFANFWQPKPFVWFQLDIKTLKLSIQAIKEYTPVYNYKKPETEYCPGHYSDAYRDWALDNTQSEPTDPSLYSKILKYAESKPEFSMMPKTFLPFKANTERGTMTGWAALPELGGRIPVKVFGAFKSYFSDTWVSVRGVGGMRVGETAAIVAEIRPEIVVAPTLVGYRGKVLTSKEYLAKTSAGCESCQFRPPFADSPYLKWWSDSSFSCKTCARKPIKDLLMLPKATKVPSVLDEVNRFIKTYITENKHDIYKAL